jgi:hypothetical protein
MFDWENSNRFGKKIKNGSQPNYCTIHASYLFIFSEACTRTPNNTLNFKLITPIIGLFILYSIYDNLSQ